MSVSNKACIFCIGGLYLGINFVAALNLPSSIVYFNFAENGIVRVFIARCSLNVERMKDTQGIEMCSGDTNDNANTNTNINNNTMTSATDNTTNTSTTTTTTTYNNNNNKNTTAATSTTTITTTTAATTSTTTKVDAAEVV